MGSFTKDANVVLDKMFPATQSFLWLVLVAAPSAFGAPPSPSPPGMTTGTPSPPPTPTSGLLDQVEGDCEQSSPPASNNWHYVSISKKNGKNMFTWKNNAGFEWDLIPIGEESGGVVKFEVGEDCPYKKDGYTEARLSAKGDKIEIEGPNESMFRKQ